MKKFITVFVLAICVTFVYAQKSKTFELTSPDKKFRVTINAGEKLVWTVVHDHQTIIAPSAGSISFNQINE